MQRGWRAAVLVLCLAVTSPACAGSSDDITSPSPSAIGSGARVLFIGNSLTYVNDVPQMVRELAAAAGLAWSDTAAPMRVRGWSHRRSSAASTSSTTEG